MITVIAYLRGQVISRAEGVVTVDVGGVGYAVNVCTHDTSGMQHDVEVVLWIHSHYSQDSLKLYGFSRQLDRDFFVYLLELPAVGPKLAQAILTRLTISQLAAAIGGGDELVLKSVPGIGHKKAQTLMIELSVRKDQLLLLAAAGRMEPAAGSSRAAPPAAAEQDSAGGGLVRSGVGPAVCEDVRSALVNLGITPADAVAAIHAVTTGGQDAAGERMDFEDVFKHALRRLQNVSR